MKLETGDRVEPIYDELHCLCGDEACIVRQGDVLTVAERRYFTGLGPMLRFKEKNNHSDDDTPPWYLARAFKVRLAG